MTVFLGGWPTVLSILLLLVRRYDKAQEQIGTRVRKPERPLPLEQKEI
jgi:hypothetical protein